MDAIRNRFCICEFYQDSEKVTDCLEIERKLMYDSYVLNSIAWF